MVNLYRRKKKELKKLLKLNPKKSKNRRSIKYIIQLELDLSNYNNNVDIDALAKSLLEETRALKNIV